jgi:hypothetical protein
MRILLYPICLLKEIWYGLTHFGIIISGHEYVEQKDKSLKCSICGKRSI